MRPPITVLLLVLAALPCTGSATLVIEGKAYASDGRRVLYRESHWLIDGGGRLVLYRCPDGRAFARKQVDDDSPSPDFTLLDARDGYREGVRHRDGIREMFQQAPGQQEHRTPLTEHARTLVIDAGFDAYLRTHWDALRNHVQHVAFVLPSLQRTLAFKVEDPGDRGLRRRFRLSLDTWYGAVIPSLEVTYTSDTRRLIEFRGISNLRDAQGRYPRVRIVFPDSPPQPASAQDLQQARQSPMIAHCDHA